MARTCGEAGNGRQAFVLAGEDGWPFASRLDSLGWIVAGLDPEGRRSIVHLDMHAGDMFGFDYPACDLLVSTAVLERVSPASRAAYADIFRRALKPGGVGIVLATANSPEDHPISTDDMLACFAGFDILHQGAACRSLFSTARACHVIAFRRPTG